MKKKYRTSILYLLIFLYLELVNKILIFNKLPGLDFIYVLLFSIPIALLLSFLTSVLSEKKNKIICTIFVIVIIIFYLFNFLYYSLLSVPFSLSDLELADQALDFFTIIFHLIKTDLVNILLIILPGILFYIYRNNFNYQKKNKKCLLLMLLSIIVMHILALLSLNINKNELYSAYNIYYNLNALSESTKKLGVLTSQRLGIKRHLFGFEEKIINENNNKLETEIKYNKLNIDFDNLIANEQDETTKNIYEYLKNKKATNQNEYTGLYQGKNLIFILAEGFNSIAVDQKRTPTLYKLIHEGFEFTNYYSPIFLSTTGGEFQAMTSLIPTQEVLGMWRKNNPYIPYALGNVFASLNYNAESFHNWDYTYYNRHKTMKTLGFTNYTACGNGLEKSINCNWLPSDIDLINETFDTYVNNTPFVTYYITVSGHAPYNFTGGNSIAIKNYKLVENLPYSQSVKAYLATQMELEYAITNLIQKLEKAGILEDTVIVLTGDHYPYTLTNSEIAEISDINRDEIIEINHSNLIIWNPNNEHVIIDKVASQIDVLPTILNLFGVEYDSRLLTGNDIFSDEEGLAIFSNRSWKTDKYTFYSHEEAVNNNYIDKKYIEQINNRVANSFTISKLLFEKEIYQKVLKEE